MQIAAFAATARLKRTHIRGHCVLAASRLKCERASAANLSVSWPDGKRGESRADCPDQRFVKSPEPSASAFARKGARLPPANGKAGAEGDSGPISRMSLFRIPRAGRPVKTLVTAVPSSEVFSSASRWIFETFASGEKR